MTHNSSSEPLLDFLIVGQGLAGTFLAYQLLQKGFKIKVINQFETHTASLVSSGIYNPVSGRKRVKVWLADELDDFVPKAYQKMEQFLGKSYYFPIPIFKFFSKENSEDLKNNKRSLSTQKYVRYLEKEACAFPGIQAPAAGIEIKGTAIVHSAALIRDFEKKLIENHLLVPKKMNYGALQISDSEVQYHSLKAKKIVFCEGISIKQNPWFSNLPIILNKGDFLIVKIKNFNPSFVIHYGIFIVPLEQDIFWCGSNYQYAFEHFYPCENDKLDLVKRLKKAINIPFEILAHQFGIRPTTIDRRPILGTHPKHQQLVVFNGLGTKGVSLAPYFAQQLCEHLVHHTALHPEVDLKRFKH